MPGNRIKELRQAGNLKEALEMAKAELLAEPDNIWPKRNISWVYYDYLKQCNSAENFEAFLQWLDEIKDLNLPAEENMLFDHLAWQIGKMAFVLIKNFPSDHSKGTRLFAAIQSFHFTKPSEGYSFLFKGLHKLLKDTDNYISFADWWGLGNFTAADYEKEKLPNGKEIMAVAEQAYIAYTKHLLPRHTISGETIFDKERADAFLPALSAIVEGYPQFQYPAYFKAKLLLALGDKNNMLASLLPFARKKRNDFWVWEIMAEAFANDPEKVFACYCKALSCKAPEEMLVSLRQKMARILIGKGLFNAAKTEIELLVQARTEHGFGIPGEIAQWQSAEWYKLAVNQKTNISLYKEHLHIAEVLMFSDTPEELVFVEFTNKDKKVLNFIATESRYGFFKYERFLKDVKVGDTLKVIFQGGSNGGLFQVYTAVKVNDEEFRKNFIRQISGYVKIPQGKSFGFIEDIFIHPSTVSKHRLNDGMRFEGTAIKSYNKEKAKWGWRLL